MADKKYITLSEEALDRLLGLVRESHSVAEGIDDENIATNSTYSSAKLQELLGDAGVQAVELTKAEYDALSEEEKNSETIYFITDVDNEGNVTGYTAGNGIEISEDKVIKVADEISNDVISVHSCQIYANENDFTISANSSKVLISNVNWTVLMPDVHSTYPDIIPFMVIPWYCKSGIVFENLGLNNSGGIFFQIRNATDSNIIISSDTAISGFKMLFTKNTKTYSSNKYTLPTE